MRTLADILCRATIHRPNVFINPSVIYVHDTARIDSFVKIEGGIQVEIGEYVHVASFCHLNVGGGRLTMEKGSACASGVCIVTGSNVPAPDHSRSCSAVHPDAVVKRGKVVIKRNAIIFCHATILPSVTIGEGAVIAAGAVVTRDVPDGETWAGVPAKRVRKPLGQFDNGLTSAQDVIDRANASATSRRQDYLEAMVVRVENEARR